MVSNGHNRFLLKYDTQGTQREQKPERPWQYEYETNLDSVYHVKLPVG